MPHPLLEYQLFKAAWSGERGFYVEVCALRTPTLPRHLLQNPLTSTHYPVYASFGVGLSIDRPWAAPSHFSFLLIEGHA